jgi:hypothetical protein
MPEARVLLSRVSGRPPVDPDHSKLESWPCEGCGDKSRDAGDEAAGKEGADSVRKTPEGPGGLSFSVHVCIAVLEVMLKAMPDSKLLSSLAVG